MPTAVMNKTEVQQSVELVGLRVELVSEYGVGDWKSRVQRLSAALPHRDYGLVGLTSNFGVQMNGGRWSLKTRENG